MRRIIFLSAVALISATHQSPPPRSVNVALETSFLFDPKDLKDNKYFVNNIRSFLDKLNKILEPTSRHRQRFRAETKPPKVEEDGNFENFFDLVKKVGEHFVNITGTRIKEAVNTIQVENKPNNRDNEVNEVQPDDNINDIIKDSINEWIKSNPDEIRTMVNTTLTEDPLMRSLARRMNNYYSNDELKRFERTFKKIKKYIDNKRDTTKLVDDLLHSAIFKKYNSLNESAKTALMGDLDAFSKFLIANNILTGHKVFHKTLSVLTRRNLNDTDVTDVNDNVNLTYNSLKGSIDKNLKAAKEKDEIKKKGATNQLIVDNVELFVEKP